MKVLVTLPRAEVVGAGDPGTGVCEVRVRPVPGQQRGRGRGRAGRHREPGQDDVRLHGQAGLRAARGDSEQRQAYRYAQ